MPLYEFECEDCGVFTRHFCVAESSRRAECPDCGGAAQKVFGAVNLRSMRPENRRAWERNERSAHEPKVCHTDCSHQSKPQKQHQQPSGRPALQYSKKPTSRPWMLGH